MPQSRPPEATPSRRFSRRARVANWEAVEEDASSDSDSGEKNGGDRNVNTDDSDDSESDDPDPDDTARHTGEMAARAKGKEPETGANRWSQGANR